MAPKRSRKPRPASTLDDPTSYRSLNETDSSHALSASSTELPFAKAFALVFALFAAGLVLGIVGQMQRPANDSIAANVTLSSSSSSSSTGAWISSSLSSSEPSLSSSSSEPALSSSSSSQMLSSSSSSSSSPSSSSSSSLYLTSSSSSSSVSPVLGTVHMVYSSHLDVGFADLSANIINTAFHTHIPRAIDIAAQARANGLSYSWLTHVYILSLFFDCPPGMGFQCPSVSEQTQCAAAIANGTIQFHAFPFNSEFELHSSDMFAYGINLTHSIADGYHRPQGRPSVISQRDVPGTTRAVIPVMNQWGIKALSIGQNPAAPPLRPYTVNETLYSQNIYLWSDPASNQSIYLLLHANNYGGTGRSDAVIIDGFPHVLIMDWRSDNSGPADSLAEVNNTINAVKAEFPGYDVVTSTFDEYINLVDQAFRKGEIRLPETSDEMGDSWIYGAGSDPVRAGHFLQLQHLRTECLSDPTCDSTSAQFFNFSRLLLKAGEHTWGADHKTWLNASGGATSEYYQWSNAEYHSAMNEPGFQYLTNSFVEQRQWSIYYPLSALPDTHWISINARTLFQSLLPASVPSLAGYNATVLRRFYLDNLVVSVGGSGELIDVINTYNSTVYANSSNPLALVNYQIFNDSSYANFLGQYANNNDEWVHFDYGKVGLGTKVDVTAETINPVVNTVYANQISDSRLLLAINLTFANHDYYRNEVGAPEQLWLEYDINSSTYPYTISVNVAWFNKTATRIPEAWWLSFHSAANELPLVNKLGSMIDSHDVMFNGSRHLHASLYNVEDSLIVITPLTTPLLCLGPEPTPFPTPLAQNDPIVRANSTSRGGVSYSLFNNIWGTNYPLAWPTVPSDKNTAFQFRVTLK